MEILEKSLFDRILASKDAFFKHQKMEDEELTEEERREILRECFDKKKEVFLQRYEKYIKPEDCPLFATLTDGTSVFLVARVQNREKEKRNVRNRRYMAVQKLQKDGKYFSDEKMREREPYLYDVMVGRFLDESEQRNMRPSVSREDAWSGLISQFEESQEISERRKMHKELSEGVHDVNQAKERISRLMAHISNKDDSEEEERDEYDMDDIREELDQISKEDAEALEPELDGTKEQLRQEFEAFMVEKFLAGKDSRFFDYENVDLDDRLDAGDVIRERDEEERWFDED